MEILERPQPEVQEPLLALATRTLTIAEPEGTTNQHARVSSSPKPRYTLLKRLKVKFSHLPPTAAAISQNNNFRTTRSSLTNSSLTGTSQITIFSSPSRVSDAETATTTTTATSILVVPSIFTFDQIHLAPLMPIDVGLQIIWERSIRVRLRTILYHEISAGSSLQELMMAGRKKRAEADHSRDLWRFRDTGECGQNFSEPSVKQIRLSSGPISTNDDHTALIVGVTIGSSVVLLSLLGLIAWLCARQGRRPQYRAPKAKHAVMSAYHFQQCPTELPQQPAQEYRPSWASSGSASTATNGPLMDRSLETSGPSSYDSQRPLLNALRWNEIPPPSEIPTIDSHKPKVPLSTFHSSQLESPKSGTDRASLQFNEPVTECVLHLKPNVNTYCGQSLQVSNQCSTFGGMVIVDGQIYGLSVAHVFKQGGLFQHLGWKVGSHTLTTPNAYVNSEICIDHSPFWYNEDEDLTQLDAGDLSVWESTPPSSSTHSATAHTDQCNSFAILEDRITTVGQNRRSKSLRVMCQSTAFSMSKDDLSDDQASDSDWSLLSLNTDAALHTLPNQWVHPGSHEIVPITRITEGLFEGEVYVLHNSRAVFGTLRGLLSTIQIDDSMFDVQMLLLNESLPTGCSGSWVVADNMLCGHIISARQDVPFAYMVPVDAIFNDIEKRRNTDDVRLPIPCEIAALSEEESDSVRSESPVRR